MDIIKEREDMEEINHFSHSHPLKLFNSSMIVSSRFDGGSDEKTGVIDCYGCKNPISNGFVYGCIQCAQYLHKACAQLPLTIKLPSLFEHPLPLRSYETKKFGSWTCYVCRNINKIGGFSYRFENSQDKYYFNACIKCCLAEIARKTQVEAIGEEGHGKIKVEHEGHPQHTLTLKLRPAALYCDACKAKDEGLFYECDSCNFWIHKTCASLDPTINLPDHHNHPLVLVYSLPEKFFKFPYYCEFCGLYIQRNDWLYHCANCRYITHIKCALNAAERPSTPRDGPSASIVDEDVNDLLHFPMLKSFTDPLKLLYFERTTQQDDGETKINHWSHHHPLILNVDGQANLSESSDQVEVCDACVRPISVPCYSCKDGCAFTLHKYCAELPQKLEHQLHPDHSLYLVNLQGDKFHECIGCFSYDNRFVYQCETCKIYLDLNCAFLPESIKHKSHKHPLIQVIDPEPICGACKCWSRKMSYACKACNFILGMECAMRSPQSLSHRYCKGHEIPLTYPPVMDHPEDFFCDICEEEMHPKYPLYYCAKCKNSFHLGCIRKIDRYENIVLRGSRNVYYHKHPLTYIRRKRTPKNVCSNCNKDINGCLVLECRARVCNFSICYDCHLKKYPSHS